MYDATTGSWLKTLESKLNDMSIHCGFHCMVQEKSVQRKEETYLKLRHNVNIDDYLCFPVWNLTAMHIPMVIYDDCFP